MGLLTRVFPAEIIDAVIAECGRTEQRRRTLLARLMAYFAMSMELHSEGSYEDVLALTSHRLAGAQSLETLFAQAAQPLAHQDTPGSWLAGQRLVAIDGTCLDVPDTLVNGCPLRLPRDQRGRTCCLP